MVISAEYRALMRHALLTLFVSLGLAASGLASAGVAFACPLKTAAAAAVHDCCPDQGPSDEGGGGSSDRNMKDCPFAQLCRAAPVIAPEVAALDLAIPVAVALNPLRTNGALVPVPESGLFRPPRTL